MKKVLLLSALAAMAVQAQVLEPKVLENLSINAFSPDGNWCVSNFYEVVTVYDVANEKTYTYAPEGDSNDYYSIGAGKPVSNTGVVVGGTDMQSASYWKDGVWTRLVSPDTPDGGNVTAYSITPDGSRICGMVSPAGASGYDGLMGVPGYWDLQPNGTYSEFIPLPFPAKDFTGRVPQYVSAVSLSDDGTMMVGQVTDFSGGWHQPILYTKNDKNEWEYTLLGSELQNPNNVKFPDVILEEPEYPDVMNFMSPEKKEEYIAALDKWYEVDNNPDPQPNPADYMTEEEIAAYNAAADEYNIYYNQLDEISILLDECMTAGGMDFVFNNIYLSGDGKWIATTGAKTVPDDDPMPWAPYKLLNIPVIFNIETGEYKTYETETGLGLSYIGKNRTVLASTFQITNTTSAYILTPDADEFVPLYDYVKGVSAETAKWMEENMTHVCMVGYDENYDPIWDDAMITGLPTANADFTRIASWMETNSWEEAQNADENFPLIVSYMFDLTIGAGITSAVADGTFGIQVADGVLLVNGDAASVTVYDLNGRVVLDVANPGNRVDTGLASGFYVVKAVSVSGDTVTVKAAL